MDLSLDQLVKLFLCICASQLSLIVVSILSTVYFHVGHATSRGFLPINMADRTLRLSLNAHGENISTDEPTG